MNELPPDILPPIRAAIASTAARLAAAGTNDERRCIQRDHVTSVAQHLADAIHAAALDPAEDADPLPDPLDAEFIVAEIAPNLFASHWLGANALSEDECRLVAVRAYLDRLHELTVGGVPWGRA